MTIAANLVKSEPGQQQRDQEQQQLKQELEQLQVELRPNYSADNDLQPVFLSHLDGLHREVFLEPCFVFTATTGCSILIFSSVTNVIVNKFFSLQDTSAKSERGVSFQDAEQFISSM